MSQVHHSVLVVTRHTPAGLIEQMIDKALRDDPDRAVKVYERTDNGMTLKDVRAPLNRYFGGMDASGSASG